MPCPAVRPAVVSRQDLRGPRKDRESRTLARLSRADIVAPITRGRACRSTPVRACHPPSPAGLRRDRWHAPTDHNEENFMNPDTAAEKAEQFLKISAQFRLGKLVTETPHPKTVRLSQTAQESVPAALGLLFDVDRDVLEMYRRWIATDAPRRIADAVVGALLAGGRIYFTGCGATGRLSIQLDSIWRDFWTRQRSGGGLSAHADAWEDRTFSVMAGGDFALIKSVEGFEDYVQFGKRQIRDRGLRKGDVVFAITEGGETSHVIGTAWAGVEDGAKVFYVYNNPDPVLRENVQRSREVIDDPRITKVNITTGPMAITGSTRMQATSSELAVMMTLLEMILRDLAARLEPSKFPAGTSAEVPAATLRGLEAMHATLASEAVREGVARLVEREEAVARARHRTTYFADRLAVDVLTDTTERSPTFCTPTYRKFDDTKAAESWSFLFLPQATTPEAWAGMLKRSLAPVEWDLATVRGMIGDADAERQHGIVRNISRAEILRFRIGLDGLPYRVIGPGDCATAILTEMEMDSLLAPGGFCRERLEKAHAAGAAAGVLFFGGSQGIGEIGGFLKTWGVPCLAALVPVPETGLWLDAPLRVGAKMLLNALSTCTMVRLGRVMGNVMIWVVPSNLKLIDRSTRYIQNLTGLGYEEACHRLFEAVEYVQPRREAGREYPAIVGLVVQRHKHGVSFEEAEERLYKELGMERPG